MIERYYAMQHIHLFTSHPPKVPFSLVPYTFSFIQVLHASQLPPSQTTKAGGKACPTSFYPFRAAPTRLLARICLAQKGCFPRIPEGIFNCRATSHQNPKIWHQKAPGQDLAQKGRFPRIPEGRFNSRATSHQNPKIWLQKAPGQDLAQKGRFPRILEGRFNCRAPSHQSPKIWLQKAPGQDLAKKGRFPRIPEGRFYGRATSHQNPKIWRQKAPGQDLAQKSRFPRIPEGSFNCRARSHQSPKSWVLTRNPWKRQVLDPKTFQKDGSSSQNQGFWP